MINSELLLLEHEPTIRVSLFAGIFLSMSLWEKLAPCRYYWRPRLVRWLSNSGLLLLGTLILRTIFPLAAVGVATVATEHHWGLLNTISLAYWQSVLFSIIFLDFTTYLQHILFHLLPGLWRIHKVHHADLYFDVTTGLRFHPFELLLSMVGKAIVVLLLGAPVIAVLLFEVILNATSLFNHGNVCLPNQLDRFLRWFVVTPNMHRIHHSAVVKETNSNYGFNLPWWDHLFGTYRYHPSINDSEMIIGLAEYQNDPRAGQLLWMLVLPFFNHLPKLRNNYHKTSIYK